MRSKPPLKPLPSAEVHDLQVERQLATVYTGQPGPDGCGSPRVQGLDVGDRASAAEAGEPVRQAVAVQRRGVAGDLEVQVGRVAVAGVAEAPDPLPLADVVAHVHGQAVPLQ